MDAQFWIYIIIGIIYFLSKLLKKPEQQPGETPENRPERRHASEAGQPAGDRPRQLTFEELLREITEGKQPQKTETRSVPQPEYQSYEDDLKDEAQSLEEVRYDARNDDEVFKAYERAKNQVFEQRSLEETMHLSDTDMGYGKFKAFEKQEKKRLSDNYIKILRNPEGLKQAVVMSEILKRKF